MSQSLWSQGGAASEYKADDGKFYLSQSLWSQGGAARQYAHAKRVRVSLNPFEVREVLQVTWTIKNLKKQVSIPLKSGRCCKPTVSADDIMRQSQSLWSQGGAARVLYKTFLLKSISYLLFFVKNFLTKSYFPKFCKERILVTEVLWHKFAFWSGFFERCVTFI